MRMTFRWFGEKNDPTTLRQIRQIPGMKGVVTSLHDVPVGEEWDGAQIASLKQNIENHGLTLDVIESLNVHEDIKLGLPSRDALIENYIRTIKKLARAGIKVVCYNFMPVFDWTRSDLAATLEDGSTALSYDEAIIQSIDPVQIFDDISSASQGLTLPGWEPDKLKNRLKPLFKQYADVGKEALWKNLEYFLNAVIPEAEKCNIRMAIHPDDPPWDIFGLPRLITDDANIERFLMLYDSPHNGLSLCSGSLGVNPRNDIPALVRKYGGMGKIHFAHIRNIQFSGEKGFHEAPHLSELGSLDMFEIVKAYHDVGFTGPARPDHGRMIWGETGRPGYGLFDRALGATYLAGLWEAIDKMKRTSREHDSI